MNREEELEQLCRRLYALLASANSGTFAVLVSRDLGYLKVTDLETLGIAERLLGVLRKKIQSQPVLEVKE